MRALVPGGPFMDLFEVEFDCVFVFELFIALGTFGVFILGVMDFSVVLHVAFVSIEEEAAFLAFQAVAEVFFLMSEPLIWF
jgi:hypothetical protein